MTLDRQHAALIALLRRAKPRLATELLEDHDTPLQVLEQLLGGGQLSLDADPGTDVEGAITDAMAELRTWQGEAIDVVTVLDEDYPLNLRTVHDKPSMLTVRGHLAASDERSIAVVGTRSATDAGLRKAAEIAGNLVDAGTSSSQGSRPGSTRQLTAPPLTPAGERSPSAAPGCTTRSQRRTPSCRLASAAITRSSRSSGRTRARASTHSRCATQ